MLWKYVLGPPMRVHFQEKIFHFLNHLPTPMTLSKLIKCSLRDIYLFGSCKQIYNYSFLTLKKFSHIFIPYYSQTFLTKRNHQWFGIIYQVKQQKYIIWVTFNFPFLLPSFIGGPIVRRLLGWNYSRAQKEH